MAQDRTATLDVVQRGSRLYNRATNSFFFSTDVTEVSMNAVVLLDFTDLPEAARRYITLKAARVFQDRVVGSAELHGYQQRDELLAKVELDDAEGQVNDNTIFDNLSVYYIVDRLGGRVL